jgi:hypothetical protein
MEVFKWVLHIYLCFAYIYIIILALGGFPHMVSSSTLYTYHNYHILKYHYYNFNIKM